MSRCHPSHAVENDTTVDANVNPRIQDFLPSTKLGENNGGSGGRPHAEVASWWGVI